MSFEPFQMVGFQQSETMVGLAFFFGSATHLYNCLALVDTSSVNECYLPPPRLLV